jgi:FAD/FMN-containing dehydrogenase
MASDNIYSKLDILAKNLEGELGYDSITRTIYSTDASVYKETPLVVVWPKGAADLKKIISFASENRISLTLRAAGTSLAGQVVASGIIADISRHMKEILEINEEQMYARVQPGVVLDELNIKLKEKGLFFGPETSTSNRCNIGGMVGNNACGSHSLVYGSTRDHTVELKTLLSDGSEAVFGPVSKEVFMEKCLLPELEGKIYRHIKEILENPVNRRNIKEGYPDPKIPRRNTGYALDLLLENEVLNSDSGTPFN